MGPGRFELPTSRLSGVRSKPTELRARINFRFSIFDFQFQPKTSSRPDSLTIELEKSNKKATASSAAAFDTIPLPYLRQNLQDSKNFSQLHLFPSTLIHRPIITTTPALAHQA
jgi:hypothetical protein